jgi:hypothetical protein
MENFSATLASTANPFASVKEFRHFAAAQPTTRDGSRSVSVPSPPSKRPRSVAVYSGQRPAAVALQIFAVVVRRISDLERPDRSKRYQNSTRIRDLRE